MARKQESTPYFTVKTMDLEHARREFDRRRGRGSKYDPILTDAEALEKGKALLVEQVSYSEVSGIRQRLKKHLGEGWVVEATKVDKEKQRYDVLIHKAK